MRTTEIATREQGSVICADHGYLVVGGCDAVCFYVDTDGAHWIAISGDRIPSLDLRRDDDCAPTVIEFVEFAGWKVHSVMTGKVISVALVRIGAIKAQYPSYIETARDPASL